MKKKFLQKFCLLTIMLMVGATSAMAADQYELVTSASDLVAGKTYIIASGKTGEVKVMKAYGSGNNCGQTDATIADGKITETAEMGILTLGGSTGAWTFNDGTYFLTATDTDSKNYLKGVASADAYSYFSISFDASDAAVITCTGKSSRNILRHNLSSKCFSCYTSGQNPVYLYKKIEGGGATTYHVNIGTIANGSATASPAEAIAGTTITLTPTADEGYVFTSWYVLDGNADEVTVTDNKFIMPASDVEVDATFTAIPTHTITINQAVGGTITANPAGSTYEGKVVSLNAVPSAGYEFESWVITGATVADASAASTTFTMEENDVTITATYIVSTSITDVLTQATIASQAGIDNSAGTAASYSNGNWDNVSYTSDAVYKGLSAFGNNISYIQIRSSNSNSGIITTTSGGKVKNVTLEWNISTSNDRTIKVYGKNTPYTDPTELYNEETQGTLLGTIVKGTSTSLDIIGDYKYIGLRSNSGAIYLNQISITWETKNSKDIEIASSGISTLCLDFDFAVPNGVTAYYVSSIEGNVAKTTTTDKVKAGTGVIIKGTAGETYTFYETSDVVAAESNKLVGVTEATVMTANDYVLKDGKFVKCTTGTLAANKAYLPASSISSAKGDIVLDFGDATGINKVDNSQCAMQNSQLYNLQGVRVNESYKGIVISNGKKYILK